MKADDLQGVSRRKAWRTTVRNPNRRPTPDLVVVFPIASWSYDRGKLKVVSEAVPVGDLTYSPVFIGEVVGTKMELIEKGDGWKIKLELKREPEMLDLLNRLQKAMAEFETQNPRR